MFFPQCRNNEILHYRAPSQICTEAWDTDSFVSKWPLVESRPIAAKLSALEETMRMLLPASIRPPLSAPKVDLEPPADTPKEII